jgi:hypothetical protein
MEERLSLHIIRVFKSPGLINILENDRINNGKKEIIANSAKGRRAQIIDFKQKNRVVIDL